MSDQRPPTAAEANERIEVAKQIFDDHATMAVAMTDEGEPWVAKVFFVEDEPGSGSLDLCCALLLTSRKLAMIHANARIAFVVGGEVPDRWCQGSGRAGIVEDDADAAAILKRIEERSDAARTFFSRAQSTAVRIHVERLKVTDLAATPPITEFTFG